VCLIEAAVGGNSAVEGNIFPPLTVAGRFLIALIGLGTIATNALSWLYVNQPERFSGLWARSRPWMVGGSALIAVGAAITTVVAYSISRSLILADPPSQSVASEDQCPVSTVGQDKDRTTRWLFLGYKFSPDSDALDQWRNIKEPCIPRHGATAHIYRVSHIWTGNPESGTLHETPDLLLPGSAVTVRGSIYGPRLFAYTNGRWKPLYYEVWASFEK